MAVEISRYTEADLPALTEIWNEVVRDGVAFPQLNELSVDEAAEFFAAQDYTAVARVDGQVLGSTYCTPITSAAAGTRPTPAMPWPLPRAARRRRGAGAPLVGDGRAVGVQAAHIQRGCGSNTHAIRLYERLGFVRIGQVPNGFLMKDGSWNDTILFYHTL